tara:strand:- start:17527 stop:18006 length:480 start_codon:yes stop_codon:yes gene_type:complete
MSAQLSYSINHAIAFAGGLYALGNHEISSRDVETAAGANFGIAVSRGTDKDNQAVIGGATGFLGITVRDLARESASDNTVQYSQYETAGVLRKGSIWAVCPTGCVPGDSVNYVDATGVLDSGAAVAGETQLDGASWESTAAAGELAILRIETSATTAGA